MESIPSGTLMKGIPIMLQTLSLDLQNAIDEVNDAREYYQFSKFQSEAAWDVYQNFVDDHPYWNNPNASDKEVEDYRNKCKELSEWAYFVELEFKEAWLRLDKAKTNLLKLQED